MAKKSRTQAAARRRQAKQRRDKRRSGRPGGGAHGSGNDRNGPSGFDPFAGVTQQERPTLEWESVLMAMHSGDTASAEVLTRRVAAASTGKGSRLHIEALAELMTRTVTSLWHRGWRPAEVCRQVRRSRRRNAHESLAAAAILGEARKYTAGEDRFDDATWHQQLDEAFTQWPWIDSMGPALASTDASAWLDSWLAGQGTDQAAALRCALEVIVTLRSLPPVDVLGPFPGSTRSPGRPVPDDAAGLPARLLERVRALLAKAEATDYPDEAEAFTAKAQEIMSRHAIDSALLGARGRDRDRERPSMRRVDIDDPYPHAKAFMVQVVCDANRARAVWSKRLGFSTVVGFSADLDIVEILFGSLLVQSTAAMLAHGSRRSAFGHNNTTAFRRAFMHSFANRIGERLKKSTQAAVDAAAAESGTDLLPVLASRQDEVERVMEAAFPDMVHSQSSKSFDRDGYLAGTVAADLADLTLFDELAG